jgi:hypothetical protein
VIDLEKALPLLAASRIDYVIVGGVASTSHGSSYLTTDLDICYSRDPENLKRLASCLAPIHPHLRGAPEGLPFLWDAETLQRGLNFTLSTDVGDLDLLGEVGGIGPYLAVLEVSEPNILYGITCRVLSLEALIRSKRFAGRGKDLPVVTELEAIREAQEPDAK